MLQYQGVCKAIQAKPLPSEMENYAEQFSTPIKRYTKSELARLYNRRVPTLMSWINNNKDLIRELEDRGYKKTLKELLGGQGDSS